LKTTSEPTLIRAWILASRPKTLTAAAAPVLVGTAIAVSENGFHAGAALAALLVAGAIQIATNLHNDVADFERGTDTGDRQGPTRAAQAGWLTPSQIRRGIAVVAALALALGGYLVWLRGWPVVLIGLASLLAGWAYTGGPWPLAYNGLGDVFTFLFFGLTAVGGTTYVQTGRLPPQVWPAGAAMGAAITALLVVNNVRDVESDARAGRRSLPVVWGRKAGVWEYILFVCLAYISPTWMFVTGQTSGWILLVWLTTPIAFRLTRSLEQLRGRALNQVLAGTARWLLLHAVLLSIGLVV
jgi:1,4-dihydroxy-2-naphthoate octaprenyltransferase